MSQLVGPLCGFRVKYLDNCLDCHTFLYKHARLQEDKLLSDILEVLMNVTKSRRFTSLRTCCVIKPHLKQYIKLDLYQCSVKIRHHVSDCVYVSTQCQMRTENVNCVTWMRLRMKCILFFLKMSAGHPSLFVMAGKCRLQYIFTYKVVDIVINVWEVCLFN